MAAAVGPLLLRRTTYPRRMRMQAGGTGGTSFAEVYGARMTLSKLLMSRNGSNFHERTRSELTPMRVGTSTTPAAEHLLERPVEGRFAGCQILRRPL